MSDINSREFDVFTQKGTSVQQVVNAWELGGRVRMATADLTEKDLTNVASAGDKVYLTKLPRNAKVFDVVVATGGGITSASDEDVGGGNKVDGLLDGLDLTTSAKTRSIRNGDGGTNGVSLASDPEKELWKQLGYSEKKDAPSQIDIFITASGSWSANQDLAAYFLYSVD